jgi:uncharacterized membrane protein AbrB (regulator of aidB expression)
MKMKTTVNKVQTMTIIFVYVVIGIAFFYVNGIETTGRAVETIPYPQKLNNTILIASAIVVVVIGIFIFYGRK